jgi:hypothetical protein
MTAFLAPWQSLPALPPLKTWVVALDQSARLHVAIYGEVGKQTGFWAVSPCKRFTRHRYSWIDGVVQWMPIPLPADGEAAP